MLKHCGIGHLKTQTARRFETFTKCTKFSPGSLFKLCKSHEKQQQQQQQWSSARSQSVGYL